VDFRCALSFQQDVDRIVELNEEEVLKAARTVDEDRRHAFAHGQAGDCEWMRALRLRVMAEAARVPAACVRHWLRVLW